MNSASNNHIFKIFKPFSEKKNNNKIQADFYIKYRKLNKIYL